MRPTRSVLSSRFRRNFRLSRSFNCRDREQSSDREWVRLAQAGDRAAFTHLVRRHQDAVHRFILRMLGSHEEALELTQETFVRAWQALPQWQPQAQVKTWIFRIASNTAMDALRRRKIVEMVPLAEDYDAPGHDAGPDVQLESRQRLRALEWHSLLCRQSSARRYCCGRSKASRMPKSVPRSISTKAR